MNNLIGAPVEVSKDRLPLFDSNCFLGYGGFSHPGAPRNAGDLLNTMDYYGISEALVFHSLSHIDSNPEDNYETLLTEVALSDRLHPCFPITTSPTANSLEQTREFVNKIVEDGVQAVRIYPRRVGPLRSYVWGPLLKAVAERSLPVFVDFDLAHWGKHREMIDWDGVNWILSDFPQIPVTLVRTSFALDRILYPLMENHPNLRIEISYYVGTDKLERLCDTYGPHRALFGTGMSQYDPGGAITLLTYSGLDQETKRMVGGDNLRNLLSKVR